MPLRIDASALSRLLGSWAEPDRPMPESLALGIEELVNAGLVPTGTTLPPQRELAATLGVARGTVSSALADLDARGIIVSTRGSGSRVRSGRGARHLSEGRMFSFTNAPPGVIDLSTGALPASEVAREVLAEVPADLTDYMATDGYFPAGLPVLRQSIADHLTTQGIPTLPGQILVTSGAQQATHLALTEIVGVGDLTLTEDPTYRGGLGVIRTLGGRIEGIPMQGGGIDVDLFKAALRRRPTALYCQTGLHNPTGQTMERSQRERLGQLVTEHGLVTVEDVCSFDLTFSGRPAQTLARLVDPSLLIMVGSLSKLFWGGLRVGWLRAEEWRIRSFLERRKLNDLASSIVDQLYAVQMLTHATAARRERQAMLTAHLRPAEELVHAFFPEWTWEPVRGGSGLWVDTGEDANTLSELGKRVDVKLGAGPGFSPHNGHRSMIRLPLWHDEDQLRTALTRLSEARRTR